MKNLYIANNQYIKVNLSNIRKNYLKMKSMLKSTSVICSAVVKANAYGLGIFKVTEALYKQGCRDFWVSDLNEAHLIKDFASTANIYVFQGVGSEEELKFIIHSNVIPVISEVRQLQIINEFLPKHSQNTLDIILNFDSGLGRDGLQIEDIQNLDMQHCNILYIMSHLSCSSKKGHSLNERQRLVMESIKTHFPKTKCTLSDSGGVFLGDDYHFDMVRVGGALYGVNTSAEKDEKMLNVVDFKASILNRKVFNNSQSVGYKATYQVQKGDKVLILNVGYSDGYRGTLSNKSRVYAEGFYLPVIGVVSMNIMTVDGNNLPDNLFYDIKNVELIGEKITIEEVAKLSNADQREILTNLSYGCKRIYIQ
jgi:alanine racemase